MCLCKVSEISRESLIAQLTIKGEKFFKISADKQCSGSVMRPSLEPDSTWARAWLLPLKKFKV
jgi:hypothetical protein